MIFYSCSSVLFLLVIIVYCFLRLFLPLLFYLYRLRSRSGSCTAFVGQARMHIPQRMHSVWLGVFVTSTSILQALAHFPQDTHLFLSTFIWKERHPVEQRVKRPQRAEPLAEGTVEYYAQHDHGKQNAEFPCKQAPQRRPDAGIGKGQRDGPSSTPCGQRYLQKNGSPMPTSFTRNAGSRKTITSSTAYLRYRRGLSFFVESFFVGILCSSS